LRKGGGGYGKSVEPRREISGSRVLYFAVVDDDVRATGGVRHSEATIVEGELVEGPPLGPFEALAIATYEGGEGIHLLYLDADWEEVTDTWHESLEDAKRQAEFEYEGITAKWKAVANR
jgi:hypothetical protein